MPNTIKHHSLTRRPRFAVALATAAVAAASTLGTAPALASETTADAPWMTPAPAPQVIDQRVQLLNAILHDNALLVRELLAAGVDPNLRESDRGPAIVMAAAEGSFAALEALLESPRIEVDATNARGETALMMATFKRHGPSVDKLIARGAAIDREGWTPMHYAASSGDVDTLRKLIARGASLNARSPHGSTPMMLAAQMGRLSALEVLVLAGADPRLVNGARLSAADYLERRGETDRAERLRAYAERFEAPGDTRRAQTASR